MLYFCEVAKNRNPITLKPTKGGYDFNIKMVNSQKNARFTGVFCFIMQ
jgi:hypothetical protein